MTIQVLKDIVLPNGMTVKAGGVLQVPDAIGAALIEKGSARLRNRPGPVERKSADLPPEIPNVRVPAPPSDEIALGAFEDRDNFVRNLMTITDGSAPWGESGFTSAPPVVPSDSASSRPPVLTLDQIKIHCHIELDQTEEDELLKGYEMAARLDAENFLQYLIDPAVGENIKQALLLLIAYWYRNRETTGQSKGNVLQNYRDLLYPERDFPSY